MANQSVIVVGVTLIWRKAVAAGHINSYKAILALFKFGEQTKNRQTAKLKSPPNKLRIRYLKTRYAVACAAGPLSSCGQRFLVLSLAFSTSDHASVY